MANITRNVTTLTTSKIVTRIAEMIRDHFGLDVDIDERNRCAEFSVLSPTGVILGTTNFFGGDSTCRRYIGGSRTGIFMHSAPGGIMLQDVSNMLDREFPVEG